MKRVLFLLVLFIQQTVVSLYGQAINPRDFYVKVRTDSGTIKKNLWEVGDSSIWVTDTHLKNRTRIPVNSIQSITVKRPLISTPLRGLGTGIVGGPLLFSFLYVWDWYHSRSRNERVFTDPYFTSLGYSVITGAIAGLATGLIQVVFTRVRIPVNHRQWVLQKNKAKLSKYISY